MDDLVFLVPRDKRVIRSIGRLTHDNNKAYFEIYLCSPHSMILYTH